MRDGGYVFDGRNRQAGLLYGAHGGFASLTGAADFYGHFAHTQRHGFFSGFVAGNLRSERSAFLGAFKPMGTGGGPRNRVAFVVRPGVGGVV